MAQNRFKLFTDIENRMERLAQRLPTRDFKR